MRLRHPVGREQEVGREQQPCEKNTHGECFFSRGVLFHPPFHTGTCQKGGSPGGVGCCDETTASIAFPCYGLDEKKRLLHSCITFSENSFTAVLHACIIFLYCILECISTHSKEPSTYSKRALIYTSKSRIHTSKSPTHTSKSPPKESSTPASTDEANADG